ncbi:hypothetical protein ACHAPQ_011837 [Fusarium lateritium]
MLEFTNNLRTIALQRPYDTESQRRAQAAIDLYRRTPGFPPLTEPRQPTEIHQRRDVTFSLPIEIYRIIVHHLILSGDSDDDQNIELCAYTFYALTRTCRVFQEIMEQIIYEEAETQQLEDIEFQYLFRFSLAVEPRRAHLVRKLELYWHHEPCNSWLMIDTVRACPNFSVLNLTRLYSTRSSDTSVGFYSQRFDELAELLNACSSVTSFCFKLVIPKWHQLELYPVLPNEKRFVNFAQQLTHAKLDGYAEWFQHAILPHLSSSLTSFSIRVNEALPGFFPQLCHQSPALQGLCVGALDEGFKMSDELIESFQAWGPTLRRFHLNITPRDKITLGLILPHMSVLEELVIGNSSSVSTEDMMNIAHASLPRLKIINLDGVKLTSPELSVALIEMIGRHASTTQKITFSTSYEMNKEVLRSLKQLKSLEVICTKLEEEIQLSEVKELLAACPKLKPTFPVENYWELFYVFHLMTCDSFYDSHPPYDGPGDRCSRDEIAAGTATQFSILGMSTTFCGTLNLFVTGWTSKKFGPRAALLVQIFIPAVRVVTQIIGVVAGKRDGMMIIQATQLITILGGPAGYILVVNIIAGEVVEPIRRTAVFGQLQGAIMLGQGIGYLTGGMIGDAIDIRAPFDVAFVSFILSGIYVWMALPYISPESMSSGGKPGQQGVSGFLAPLKILTPQKLRLADGRVKKHLGVIFLCSGIFLGVLATGYAPLLIQMYATAAFNFSQADNGWLMSEFAIMRSFFLILLFPRIINWGRGRVIRSAANSAANSDDEADEEATRHIPTTAGEFDATLGEQVDHEPYEAVNMKKEDEGSLFDLVFLRWSLLIDGALTTVAAFATRPWHIYLAAFLLPFGSGSAPAAKGVITQMCPDSQRADALNAVTLVENVARLATQGLFGFIFASLAEVGKAYATFFCNAAIAILAMGVLLFSNFPPTGSTLIERSDEENEVNDDVEENEPLLY